MSTAVFFRASLPVLVFSTNSIWWPSASVENAIAVAFLNADFLQQFKRLGRIVRIFFDVRIIPFLIAWRHKTIGGNARPE